MPPRIAHLHRPWPPRAQIMLSEMLPTTGYLTDMHTFTFCSTLLVICIAVSHVLIFGIQSKGARKERIVRRLEQLRRSRQAVPAAIRLQRRVRVHLALKRLQKTRLAARHSENGQAAPAAPLASRARVQPAGGKLKLERRESQATSRSVLALMGQTRDRASWRGHLVRFGRRLNEAFEFFCVYCLVYLNWLIALIFASAYVIIIATTFKGRGSECY